MHLISGSSPDFLTKHPGALPFTFLSPQLLASRAGRFLESRVLLGLHASAGPGASAQNVCPAASILPGQRLSLPQTQAGLALDALTAALLSPSSTAGHHVHSLAGLYFRRHTYSYFAH